MNKMSFQGFVVAYLIALVPLLFRMVQCYRQAKQDTGQFRGHIQMWNFGKYCSSMLTSTFSFIYAIKSEEKTFLVIYICSSVCSTLYAYYWDLVRIILFRNTIGASQRQAHVINFSETISVTKIQRSTIMQQCST